MEISSLKIKSYTNGFNSSNKILDSSIYKTLLNTKPVLYNKFFNIHIINNYSHSPRLGIIIGKKLCKHACKRNYIKRCMREIFRINKHFLANKDVLMRLKIKVDKSNLSQARQQLLYLEKHLIK